MTNAWNNLLTTAMLGTERGRWNETELPPELAAVQLPELDTEDRFLHRAALLANYRRCGYVPPVKAGWSQAPAPEEEKPYCTMDALRVLKDILETDSAALLRLWLQACTGKGQIVSPEWAPVLLEKAVKQKHLQEWVVPACGHRGAWLSGLNPAWQFSVPAEEENVWETGTLEQRLGYLKNQRRVDASAARSLLQQVWKSENAATRSELLSALETGLGAEDEPWIAELLSDKSIKVREEALRLLKILPHSSLVQRYQEVLAAAVSVKKEKGLLGLGSKTTLEVVLPAGSDDLYKTGLEKTSSEKGVSDEAHLLYQLVASVPPQFWETQLQKAPADIVDLFAKHPAGKNLLPALAKGTAQFADEAWARVLSERAGDFYPGLLPVLPAAGWERYVLEHFNAHSEPIVAAALQRNAPWSPDLARAILKHTAQHGYHYPPHFYNNIAHLLPLDILPGLESFAPSDAYMLDIWNRTKEQIKRLLTLKSRIPAAFAGGPSVYNEPFIIHPT